MGAWIEMSMLGLFMGLPPVAPNMGAWIEIDQQSTDKEMNLVAPNMGAWIEIGRLYIGDESSGVAPNMGAWIEIIFDEAGYWRKASHPTWVRGLKLASALDPYRGDSRTQHGCVD